ncbi:MAG: hypothetical protein AAF697_03585 [Pseudomonadota bacterium]
MRIDDGPTETGVFPEPRSSNSFLIGERSTLGGPKAAELKLGKTVTFGLQFDGREEVVVVDQSQSEFRAWIDSCSPEAPPETRNEPQVSAPEQAHDLTYQEQLQRNGAVDGRSKDYFTSDGDTEFGGAVVGMLYDDFSDRLQFAGFIPLAVSPRWRCHSDSGSDADCNYQYPETESCDDTEEAICRYLWTKGSDDFVVVTEGGEGGTVTAMTYNR